MSDDEQLALDLPPGPVVSNAVLSDDGLYRYVLYRRWTDHGVPAVFVMLNPSTADAFVDDPTIRRCIGFAKTWGCTALVVVNLYAYRSTKPESLWTVPNPVGPENDRWLTREFAIAANLDAPLVAAWGTHGREERIRRVLELPGAHRFTCLGTTQSGAPRHPLYLPANTSLTPWNPNGRNDP